MKKNTQNLKSDSKNSIFYFLFSKFSAVLLLSTFYFLFSGISVFAAELMIDSNNQEIRLGDQFEAGFFLNTDNENINAVEGKIVFPEKFLELKEIRDGNSIINFWIERPGKRQGTSDTQPGEIVFSGIIPGGYQETKGLVFSVVFQAKASGSGTIEIHGAKVLLNDGEGTPASVKLSPFQFSISQEAPAAPSMIETVKDINLPEDFEPKIASDPNIFNGKYFLVFATQDKESGIDHYEVCERSKRKCVIAESPYLLQNQKLDQQIFVKAVDKNGNERVVMLPPQKPLPWYKNYSLFVILIIAGVTLAYLIRKFLWRKQKK